MLALMAIVVEQPPSRKRNIVAEKGGESEGKRKNMSISIDITAYSISPIVLGTTVG
jgi:hypothetical protein